MKTAKRGCGFWSLAAELHAGGSCGLLGWQLLGAGSKELVEVGDLFVYAGKKKMKRDMCLLQE